MSSEVKEETKPSKPCCQKKVTKMIKISELPIYGNPYPSCDRVVNEELGYIESGVKTVRQEINPYLSVLANGSQRVGQILTTAYYHSKSTYEYISSEGNTVAKAMAITGGGLIGLLISSRKGFFKKLFYTSAGLTAATAACYPNEAKDLSQIGLFIAKTKGPELIKEYTGVDFNEKVVFKERSKIQPKSVDQIGQEVSDVQYFGFRLQEGANKSQSTPDVSAVQKSKPGVDGDFGMSRKEDKDLYANRSTK